MKTIKILVVVIIVIVVGFGLLLSQKKPKNSQQVSENSQEATRQRDISEIRKFANSSDLAVAFESNSESSNGNNVTVAIYIAGADRYEVDANGKIIEFGSRNLPLGSENEKIVDSTPRYNQQELETMARQLIVKNALAVDLEKLTLNKNTKGTNYFFRWEDKSQKTTEGFPFIQVSFSQGGTLLGYINTL